MRNIVNANCVTHFGNVGGMEASDRLKKARIDAGFRTAADAYRQLAQRSPGGESRLRKICVMPTHFALTAITH